MSIENFWPKDTDKEIYLESEKGYRLWDVIRICKDKWPETSVENLSIRAEKIHTSCLTYDLHDESDWTNFIVVEKKA